MMRMTKSNAAFRGGACSILVCVLVGASIAFALSKWGSYNGLSESEWSSVTRSLGSAISQISVTLAGFILTSTAIFTAFSDKPLVQNMYKSGHAKNLIIHMYIAIFFTMIACVSGIWALVMPISGNSMIAILFGVSSASLAALLGVMRKLWYVLNFVHGERENQAQYEAVNHDAKEIPPRASIP